MFLSFFFPSMISPKFSQVSFNWKGKASCRKCRLIMLIPFSLTKEFYPVSGARLSQEWTQGLMCIQVPFLSYPQNLNIFELKCILWKYEYFNRYVPFKSSYILKKIFFLRFLLLLKKNFQCYFNPKSINCLGSIGSCFNQALAMSILL